MPGLKASTESSATLKKPAAKGKKNKSTGKPSALSDEYVLNSDSDGGIEDSTKSRTPTVSVEASKPSILKSKNIVTPPATASKFNGSSKAKNVDQSAKKNPGGSRDRKVNGNTPQSVKQPESISTQKPERLSIQAKGGPVTTTEKSGAKPIATSRANLPARRKLQDVVESEDNSDEGEEEMDDGSSDSIGLEEETTKKIAAQPPLKSQSSSSQVMIPKASAPKQKLASLESSVSSTSDESSSGEEMSPKNDSVKRAKQPQTPSKPTAAIYKPPAGFSPASISHPEASDLPNLFSPTYLASKQIWHLTLPAVIPISAIKNIMMDKILRGGTALVHNGSEYGFFSNTKAMQNHAHVLLPYSEQNDYRAAPKAITRSLHLQQMLNLPSLEKAAKDNASGPQAQRQIGRVVHEQPSGLKMRYAPFGDESGTLGLGTSSDEEDGEAGPAEAVFRMPPSLGNAQQKDKRRVNGADDTEDTSPVKRSPKKRRMEEVKDDVVPETPSKKRRKKRRRDEDNEADVVEETPAKTKVSEERLSHAEVNDHDKLEAGVRLKNGVMKKHKGETLEEKSKRKAEKNQRKEEHKKRKEEKNQRKEEHKKRKEEKKRKKTESQESALSVKTEA